MRATPISADYLRTEMSKAYTPQTDSKINELIDSFALLNQHGHLTNIGMERKTYHRRRHITKDKATTKTYFSRNKGKLQ